jgi:hypothetical protein
MKSRILPLTLLLGSLLVGCDSNNDAYESEIDPNETIEQSPDYEDGDSDNDGTVTYEEQSARGESTTNTTNYADRADSLAIARDTLVDPKYTDDEYEPAFSTSTTNPKNQVEGGVTPGDEKKDN